jgi:hypothetical protein
MSIYINYNVHRQADDLNHALYDIGKWHMMTDVCLWAARRGLIDLMKWARQRRYIWDYNACMGAAHNRGHFELKEWMRANIDPPDFDADEWTRANIDPPDFEFDEWMLATVEPPHLNIIRLYPDNPQRLVLH